MTDEAKITLVSSMGEFFKDALTKAMQKQLVRTSAETEYYLVSLLSTYARSDAFYDDIGGVTADTPLAIQLKLALESPADQGISILKRLGDGSLYTAGFFSTSLKRRNVGLRYYVQMGRGAYNILFRRMRAKRGGEIFANIYQELSVKFRPLVDVLAEISDRYSLASPQQVIDMYDKWLETRSRHLAERLIASGLLPILDGHLDDSDSN